LQLQQHPEAKRNLAISGSSARTMWSQTRPAEKPKRYKAVMKQVVGTPFAGLCNQDLEREIVQDLVSASKQRFDDPGLPRTQQRQLLDLLLDKLISKVKQAIGLRAKKYLESITFGLLDPATNLP
jgi:hypothetical protein